jgi:hypothetical protein
MLIAAAIADARRRRRQSEEISRDVKDRPGYRSGSASQAIRLAACTARRLMPGTLKLQLAPPGFVGDLSGPKKLPR